MVWWCINASGASNVKYASSPDIIPIQAIWHNMKWKIWFKKNDDCWVRQKLENKLLGLRFSSPAGSESYSR